MGSWYPTCALSNLPIIYNEPVMAIPLFQNTLPVGCEDHEVTNGYTYADAAWQPVAWPITGKLGTCEGDIIERPRTTAPKLWSAVVHNRTGHNLAPATFLRKLRRSMLKSRHGMWPNSKVACCFIRPDVWALMKNLKLSEEEIWYRDDGLNFKQYAEIPDLWIKDHEAFPEERDLGFAREQRFSKHFCLRELQFKQKLTDGFLIRMLRDKNFELTDVKLGLEGLSEVMFVQAMMDRLRRFWSPQSGCGSQDIFLGLHGAFLDGLQEIAHNAAHALEDDEDEGEDEDDDYSEEDDEDGTSTEELDDDDDDEDDATEDVR